MGPWRADWSPTILAMLLLRHKRCDFRCGFSRQRKTRVFEARAGDYAIRGRIEGSARTRACEQTGLARCYERLGYLQRTRLDDNQKQTVVIV